MPDCLHQTSILNYMDPIIPVVELYCIPMRPATPILRRELREAMTDLGLLACWEEHHHGTEGLPGRWQKGKWKRVGPPLLSINRRIVQPPYSVAVIRQPLSGSTRAARYLRWKRGVNMYASFLLSIFVAFFPKCPLCWAAYLSLFGLAGSYSIPYHCWMLPVSIVLLGINLLALYFNKEKHRANPFWLSLAGAIIIISNRLFFSSSMLLIAGAVLLLTASLWNTLSWRMSAAVHALTIARVKRFFGH